MLTPLDIHNKEFRRGFRGYDADEVDEFLDQVVREFEGLLKEDASLKERLEDVQGQLTRYRQLEGTLQSTLVVAQEAADELKENARKEAELITREAELKAERLVQEAERRVRQAEERLQELHHQALAFRAQWRSMLESHLELLREAGGQVDLAAVAIGDDGMRSGRP